MNLKKILSIVLIISFLLPMGIAGNTYADDNLRPEVRITIKSADVDDYETKRMLRSAGENINNWDNVSVYDGTIDYSYELFTIDLIVAAIAARLGIPNSVVISSGVGTFILGKNLEISYYREIQLYKIDKDGYLKYKYIIQNYEDSGHYRRIGKIMVHTRTVGMGIYSNE